MSCTLDSRGTLPQALLQREKEREREANKNHIMTDRQKRTEEAMGEAMYQMAMSYPDSRHLQIHDGKDGQP